jgi:hypothetical protein
VVSSEPAGHAATSDVASTSKASASAKAAAEVAATHSSSEVAAATTEVTAATPTSVTTTTTAAACQRISRNGAASQGQSNEQNRDSLQPGFLHGIRLSVGDDSSPSIVGL